MKEGIVNVLRGGLAVAAIWAVVAPAPAAAQAAAKVAVIDVRRLVTDSVAGKDALARLRKLQEDKIAEAKSKQDEIDQLRKRLNEGRLSLADDKIAELEKQLEEKVTSFRRFQEDESVPFLVLSLKAGGSGLNLTAATHVIHFDRWWNPAVENQATDRAFRIGQTKNVLVHKFVCRGTVEEKIDALIESKQQLTREVLEGGAELNLTELGDDELLRLVALDLGAAMRESDA